MMEAIDGFLIVLNAADGHIMYTSESITSLLGHIPSDLRQMSLYDLLNEEDQRSLYKMLQMKIAANAADQDELQPVSDITLRVKRCGVGRSPTATANGGRQKTEHIRFSGFFRRWYVDAATSSSNSQGINISLVLIFDS